MILLKKMAIFVVLFVVITITTPNRTFAQNLVQQYYQPTPTIISPPSNSTLSGTILVNVYIPTTVIYKMELYSGSIFLGLAQPAQTSSTTDWFFNWDTTTVTNGQYDLKARATIGSSGYPIDTFSQAVNVKVNNLSTSTTTPPTSGTTTGTTQTTGTTTTNPIPNSQTTGTVPKIADKVTQTNLSTNQELVSQSKSWKTVSQITLPKKSANQLEKIAYKIDSAKKEYLIFSGISSKNAQVNITIQSDPIVITTRADSSGNWEYVFEKPLEPGEHQVKVEIIGTNGEKTASGPFSFLIARAQASSDNPTGASLQLVDPMGQTYLYYALFATCLIFIALIILLIIRAVKRKKMKGESV